MPPPRSGTPWEKGVGNKRGKIVTEAGMILQQQRGRGIYQEKAGALVVDSCPGRKGDLLETRSF